MDWKVTLSEPTIDDREIAAVTQVLRSRWLTMGPVTREFEREFAASLGEKEAVAVNSGTAALHLAALILGLGPGAEVIVPSLSFVATAAAMAMTGAKPVFADISSEDDLTISPDDVVRCITPRTRAFVVMHYAGYPANMEKLLAIAHSHDLKVIEDAAHSPLVRTPLGMLGMLGDIGCFSFFTTKNITMGEGGMITSPYPDLLQKARALRSHCMTSSSWEKQQGRSSMYDVEGVGFNYRPTEIGAAIGRVQLQKQADDRVHRRRLTHAYIEALRDIPGLKLPFSAYSGDAAYHLFPLLLPPNVDRSQLQACLGERKIQSSVHFPPIHLFSHYRSTYGYRPSMLPLTEEIAARELSLPLHSNMQEEDVWYVAQTLRQVLKA